MTEKQKRFCDEYLISLNATDAAIKAGYSAKTARRIGSENLTKLDIRTYIDERLENIRSPKIADAEEVMEYLSSVLRGESRAAEVIIVGLGDGMTEAQIIEKPPAEKERLKAAELIAKRYGMLTDKTSLEAPVSVVIKNDLEPD